MTVPFTLALAGDTSLGGELFAADFDAHGLDSPFGPALRGVLSEAQAVHINLEMCVTADAPERDGPDLHLRMHPRHIEALQALHTRHVSLANNHILDHGVRGMFDTTQALDAIGVRWSGLRDNAGTVLEVAGKRLGFLSAMMVPEAGYEAEAAHIATVRAGHPEETEALTGQLRALAQQADDVVVSLHFEGDFLPSWDLDPAWWILVEALAGGGARVIHLHGSHHVLGIRRVDDTLVLAGCGGLLDDFGSNFRLLQAFRRASPGVIPDDFPLPASGRSPVTLAHPDFRNDLGFVAFVDLSTQGLPGLRLLPTRIDDLRVEVAQDTAGRTWLQERLSRLSPGFSFEADTGTTWIEVREMIEPTQTEFDFSSIDRGAAPGEAVRYLDTISCLSQISRYKADAIARLGLIPGERVLDIGCGVGGDVINLAEIVGPAGLAVGIDASAVMIEEARRRQPADRPVRYEVGYAHALPFDDGSFDAVRFDRMLMHVPDVRAALAEAVRVLVPGGRLVATEPDWDTMTIASDDLETTRAVVFATTDSFPNGTVGRHLPGIASSLGLVAIEVGLQGIVFDRFRLADEFWQLRAAVRFAVERGTLKQERAQAWLEEQSRRDEEGRFLCTLTGFGLRAVVPPSGLR
jgi:SAM-dependent methyltransferase